jgi:hypothetical protein
LEDYTVLIYFKDIFVDEIPELPPRKEIDFSIDLISGSASVSKSPYRMSIPKLSELNVGHIVIDVNNQCDDLLS